MPRKMVWMLCSLLLFIGWIGINSIFLSQNTPDLASTLSPARPSYVPETAIYRMTGQMWIDIHPSADSTPNKFECTVYNPDSVAVEMRRGLLVSPEIDAAGTFELEGRITSVDEVRKLVNLYDGELLYLKDGRLMTPVYN